MLVVSRVPPKLEKYARLGGGREGGRDFINLRKIFSQSIMFIANNLEKNIH